MVLVDQPNTLSRLRVGCRKRESPSQSPAFIEIVHELATEVGDDVEVREYKRLSRLQPQRKAVGCCAEVKAGDCVVAFSRKELLQLREGGKAHALTNNDGKAA